MKCKWIPRPFPCDRKTQHDWARKDREKLSTEQRSRPSGPVGYTQEEFVVENYVEEREGVFLLSDALRSDDGVNNYANNICVLASNTR